MAEWTLRIHDSWDEDDPDSGTVMWAHDAAGPWHDMVTGHVDHCREIIAALYMTKTMMGDTSPWSPS